MDNISKKLIFIALVLTLFVAGTPMKQVGASMNSLTEEEAIEILEALEVSSIKNQDGTFSISEERLEKALKNDLIFIELREELKKNGLLTSEVTDYGIKELPLASGSMMVASDSSDQINPKWKAARDACARDYIGQKYGYAGATAVVAALLEGDFKKGLKMLLSKGANLTLAALVTSYGHMNYKCIKEANSKHKVYK